MATHPAIHPSADTLRALVLSQLNDSTAATLISHLEACVDCYNHVATLPGGTDLLNRLRQARSHSSTSTAARTVTQLPAGSKSSPSHPALVDVPPELASNPQYEMIRELGRGGMGVVYLAKNKLMDRLEVLKVVNKALLDHPGALERFLREIRSAAKLSHANVVGAYSAVQQGELLAFAMEYVEGQDLASLVKSQGPLPIINACFYVQQAALGLQHAHERGMVHRDIKPQNLILAREGKKHIVKVLDFGLAKATQEKKEDTGLTGEGRMLGTPDYIAPEQQLDAARADIRADIYSLGCTLYYLLAGHPPFSGNSLTAVLLAHQMQEARPLNLERPEVPEELAAVVRKMMAKAPDKRYQTPKEVVQALNPFVRQQAIPKPMPEPSVGAAETKPIAKQETQVSRSPAPKAEAPKTQTMPANVWETLTQRPAPVGPPTVEPPKSEEVRAAEPVAAAPTTRKKWLLDGGIAAALLLLALLGMLAGGVFKVKTKDDTLVPENSVGERQVVPVNLEPETVVANRTPQKTTAPKQLPQKTAKGKVPPQQPRIAPKPPPEPRVEAKQPPPVQNPPPVIVSQKTDDSPPAPAPPPPPSFVSLFNGRDLTGWKTHPKQPGNWKVIDGAIVGTGPMSHLFSVRSDFENFHFRMEAMVNDEGNSGLFFRAQFGPGFPKGYEAQINSNGRDPLKTGSLYGIVNVFDPLHKPNEWFTQEIIAEGDHIRIKVNGNTVVDTHDSRYKRGHFALEQHDSATVVKFRKIEIKELPAGAPVRIADGFPAEAREAAQAYEKACGEARGKLLADFDTVVERLSKMKGSANPRLKLIEVVKEEKNRFENKGFIPWSQPMRPAVARYFASLTAAEEKVRRAYDSLAGAHLKAKKDKKVAELQADLANVIGVKVLAKWQHFGDGKPQGMHFLFSNGRIDNAYGKATWLYADGVLIYRWPDPKAPGGVWIDTLNVSADGTAYAGTNNFPPGKRPKITGNYVKDD